jgi:hypothetical protein
MLGSDRKDRTQVEQTYSLEVIPIKYGKVTDIYETMNSLISLGGGGVRGCYWRWRDRADCGGGWPADI